MPCHVRSARLPKKRRRPSISLGPPRIVAHLNMNNEVERDTQAFLTRTCSGRWPMWRLFEMRRHGDVLFVCVQWLRSRDEPYSLVEIALDKIALSWRSFPTAAAALAAFAALDAQHSPPHAPAAPTAPIAV